MEGVGFGLHVEILVKAFEKGYTAIEIPIHYQGTDKESNLSYKKQFKSYLVPVLIALRRKYLK